MSRERRGERRVSVVLLGLLACGCAARPSSSVPDVAAARAAARTTALQRADALATQGCYVPVSEAVRPMTRWARYNRAVALSNSGDRDAARTLAEDVAQQGGPPAAAASDLLVQLGRAQRETPPAA